MKRGLIFLAIVLLLVSLAAAARVGQAPAYSEKKVIVIMKEQAEAPYAKGVLKQLNTPSAVSPSKIKRSLPIISGYSASLTQEEIASLENDPGVQGVYEDYVVKAMLDVSVPKINATLTWNLVYNSSNLTGAGQSVCIVDTGVDYTLSDLGGCTNNSFLNGSCAKVPAGYDFVNEDSDPVDDHGHGTHVSGIVASTNSTYRGVAPGSKIIAMKVLDSSGSGYSSDIISAIQWCVNNASTYNITVISMSLGGLLRYSDYCDEVDVPMRNAVNNATNRNITVIAATGNSGSSTGIASPACLQNTIAVAASDDNDAVSSISDRNNITDLLAPGVYINSLMPTVGCDPLCSCSGGFMQCSGTSMAAPHVAGAAALLNQYRKLDDNYFYNMTQIRNTLNTTGKKINDSGGTLLNFSRINIFDAIKSLDTTAPNLTFIAPTPENNANAGASAIINISSNEVLSAALLEWNSVNQSMNGSYQSWFITKTINTTGAITYRVFGNDSSGNFGVSAARTLNSNNSAPSMPTIIYPSNNSYYSYKSISINLSSSDFNNDSLSYYLFINGSFNTSSSANITLNFLDGYYKLEAYASDSANISQNTTIYFTVANSSPAISFGASTANTSSFYSRNWIYLDVSADVFAESNITFSLYNATGSVNQTTLGAGNRTINFTSLNFNSNYYYNVTVRDLANHSSSTETRNLTLDSTYPAINFSVDAEQDNSNRSRSWIAVNVSVAELNEANITFYLYSTAGFVYSYNFSNATRAINLTSLSNSTYYYNATACDSAGNCNSTATRTINLQTAAPKFAEANATNVNNDSANIRWSSGRASNATIEYGATEGYGTTANVSAFSNPSNYTLTGLNQGAAYYYRLNISDVFGNQNSTAGQFATAIKYAAASFNATAGTETTLNATNNITLEITASSTITNAGVNITTGRSTPENKTLTRAVRYAELNATADLIASLSSVVIKIYYSDSELSNLSEASLSLYYYNSSLNNWTQLSSTVYASANFVLTNVTHFSSYALSGQIDNSYPCSAGYECYSGYCVHDICRQSSPYCGDSHCDSGEGCSSCPADCGGCVSSSASSSSGGGGGGSASAPVNRAKESYYYQEVLAENLTTALVNNSLLPVSKIVFSAKKQFYGVQLSVEKITDPPESIANAYQYLKLTTNLNEDEISAAQIYFNVNKSWIAQNGFSADSVYLSRYSSGWEKLDTNLINSTASQYSYSASAPGFSYFAVAAEKIKAEEPIQQNTAEPVIVSKETAEEIQLAPQTDDQAREIQALGTQFMTLSTVFGVVLIILVVILFHLKKRKI